VGVRISNDPAINVYEEFVLRRILDDTARSDEPPTLTEFQDRLYVIWKTGRGGSVGHIAYTSTEDGTEWEDIKELSTYKTKSPPATATFGGRLYIAYLANQGSPAPINIISTADADIWTTPTTQVFSQNLTATSPYTPAFTVYQKQLTMFWSAPDHDSVYTAPLNVQSIDSAYAANSAVTASVSSAQAEKIDRGKWQTKIGNAAVYRSGQQWIITTTKNGEISIATSDGFTTKYNLTKHQPTAKSARRVGATLIPGYFGRTNYKPWMLVIAYRGFGNDSAIREVFIALP
jgi:hypothetical protein